MRHLATLRRRIDVHRLTTVLAFAGFWVVSLGVYATSGAAFSGSTSNPLTTFATDSLDPPGSFSASRPCTPLGAAYRASTTKTTIGGSSLSLTTPTTAVGDYLIMSVMAYNNGGSAVAAINPPAGWTSLGGNFADGANFDVRLAVFALAAPASPPASYTVSFSTIAV